MLVLDANVLIYAFRRDLPQHPLIRRWLEGKLSGNEPLEILALSELAFLRITTNPRAFVQPSGLTEAVRFLEKLRSYPVLSELRPGPEHRHIFLRLAADYALAGNDLSDAFIAAATIEAGATLASSDRGFARFRNLRWVNPLREE